MSKQITIPIEWFEGLLARADKVTIKATDDLELAALIGYIHGVGHSIQSAEHIIDGVQNGE